METNMTKYQSYEDLLAEAKDPHVTADTLNILISRTREMSSQKKHEVDKLEQLIALIETKLAQKT